MFSTCFLCQANALFSVMFICDNPVCGRLFCQKCAQGFLKTSCPRCGHAGTLKPPDELKKLFGGGSQRIPTAPTHRSTDEADDATEVKAKRRKKEQKEEAASRRAFDRAERERKDASSVLERLLYVLNRGGFESKGGWFSGPKTMQFTADTPLDEICDDDIELLLRDLQDEFDEICSVVWGDDPYDFMARRRVWIYADKKSARAFADFISSKMPSSAAPSLSQIPSAQTIAFGTCLHLAAVIAAIDGKLASTEIDQVSAALVQLGLPDDKLKERFIAICRRVHSEGVEPWADRICAMLQDASQSAATEGMAVEDLIKLLKRVAKAGGGEADEKRALISRFKAAMRT